MKKTMKLMVALLLLALTVSVNAQNNSVSYTTTHEGNQYMCTSSEITTISQNTYNTHFVLMTFDNSQSIGLVVGITTFGDKEVVNIARLHTNGDANKPFKTKGRITMENGDNINVGEVLVADLTNEDKKKSAVLGAAYMSFIIKNDVESIAKTLRTKNIQKIEINGHTIDMRNVKVNTASIIDQMFKEVIGKGYRMGSSTFGAESSANKSKNALELVYYPLGILSKDVTGLTYTKALNAVKSKTTWKINEFPDLSFFNIYDHDGYDICWDGLRIYEAEMSLGKYLNWLYSIHLNKSAYSLTQAKAITEGFIKEIVDGGFSVKSGCMEGQTDYPIDKELRKGSCRVEVILTVMDDFYWMRMYCYPNWKF